MLHKSEAFLFPVNLKIIISLSIIFFMAIGMNAAEAADIEKMPIITHLGLAKLKSANTSEPPKELILDIRISNEAYYKISFDSAVIGTGVLGKGPNRVGIDAGKLFDEPGTHVYILETNSDQWNFRYEITLEVQLITPVTDPGPEPDIPPPGPEKQVTVEEFKEVPEPGRYDLAMYINNRLVAKTRKIVLGSVIDITTRKIEKILAENKKDPSTHNPGNPFALSIPIGTLIQELLKKKKPLSLNNRQLELSFWRKEKSGALKKVEAVIRLQSRIIHKVKRRKKNESI